MSREVWSAVVSICPGGLNPVCHLIAAVMASSIGGTATQLGDPPTIISSRGI